MTSVMTAQPDVMRGLVRLSAVGVPSGNIIVTRQAGRGAPDTIRGGTFNVTNGGFIATDSEPLFGTSLTYRVVDTPTSRAIQTNRVLNPKAAVDLTNAATGPNRVLARETDPTLAPPRDAVTSFRVPPYGAGNTYQTVEDRTLLSLTPSGFGTGRWYVSGQMRYDSPDIWLWDDVKTAGTWQTIKNRGTWQDVKAANSPLAGQPFASLWATVLGPTKTPVEKRRNLVLSPRAIATTGKGNAAGTGGAVTASVATGVTVPAAPSTTTAYRITWTTANTAVGGSAGWDGRASSTQPIPVTVGTTYTFSAYALASKAQTLRAQIVWFNAAGTQLSVSSGTAAAVAANTAARYSVTGTAPASAAYVELYINVDSTGSLWAINDWLEVTAGLLEASGTLGAYFDGASAALGPNTHAWLGTADASASTESLVDYVPVVAPFQILGVQTADNGGWATFQGIVDVPAGAPANSRLVFLQGNVLREWTVTWWLSTLMVCPEAESLRVGAVLPYFDGDTALASVGDPGDRLAPGYDWKALSGDASIAWQGTPNASWSQFTGPSQIFSDVSTAIGKPTAYQLPRVNQPIFLSDPVVPQLSQWFELVEIGDLTFSARQQLFDVLGREAQIAVSQVRSWASGEMRLMTYTPEQQAVAERLFGVGRILYWRNPDPRYPENGWYVAIGDVVAGRPGATVGWAPERIWRIPFVKVERPEGLIAASSSVTWSTVKSSYTWQQLRDQRKDWLDAAITAPGT